MTLKEIIEANPQGFTLQLNTDSLVKFNGGYQVALTDYAVDNGEELEVVCKRVLKAANQLQNMSPNVNYFIGGWRDDEGKLYLDISVHTPDLIAAICLGHTFKQKSIYSWEYERCETMSNNN